MVKCISRFPQILCGIVLVSFVSFTVGEISGFSQPGSRHAYPNSIERGCSGLFSNQHTPNTYEEILLRESKHYLESSKFTNKIQEADAQWKKPQLKHDGRFGAIHKYLEQLISDLSTHEPMILELGFGAGTNMIVAHELLGRRGEVWGLELTPGWVSHAKNTYVQAGLHFLHGDITNARSAVKRREFDIIFLADVYEHIPGYRLQSLWENIVALLKPCGKLYLHIPTEKTQVAEQAKAGSQFFEEIVRTETLQKQANCFGMKIEQTSPDEGINGSRYLSVVLAFDTPLCKTGKGEGGGRGHDFALFRKP